jgi:hypothetical protein
MFFDKSLAAKIEKNSASSKIPERGDELALRVGTRMSSSRAERINRMEDYCCWSCSCCSLLLSEPLLGSSLHSKVNNSNRR